jgi:colanic acid biosynthesis glycosyl transferase WcaI
MKKVLIVTQYYPPEPFRVGDLAEGLVERGFEVTVLTGFPNYPKGKIYDGYTLKPYQVEYQNGVKVVRVVLFPDTSYSALKRAINYASYAISASLIGPFLIDKKSYDSIITWQLSPVTIGLPAVAIKTVQRSKAPIFFCVQDIWPESLAATGANASPRVIAWIRKLVGFLYHSSEKVLVQSLGMVPKVLEYGIPKDKVGYLPNWAESLYRPVAYNENLAREEGFEGKFNVVFGGNVGSAQNLEVVVEAAKLLQGFPDIRFVIYGDGAHRTTLEKAAEGLSNLVFRGRRPAEAMPELYALADVLLVTLRREPLFAITVPSKVQSYLACGKPILAGLEGSGAEIIQEAQAGDCFIPDSPESLKEAVLKLYSLPPTQRAQLGANGRRYFETHFERSAVLDKLAKLVGGSV